MDYERPRLLYVYSDCDYLTHVVGDRFACVDPTGHRLSVYNDERLERDLFRAQGGVQPRSVSCAPVASWGEFPYLASGHEDGTVRVWDSDTLERLHELRVHRTAVVALLVTDAQPRVISLSEGELCVWTPGGVADLRSVRVEDALFLRSYVSSEGEFRVIVVEGRGSVLVIDPETVEVLRRFRPWNGEVLRVVPLGGSRFFVGTCSRLTGTCVQYVCNVESGEVEHQPNCAGLPPSSGGYSDVAGYTDKTKVCVVYAAATELKVWSSSSNSSTTLFEKPFRGARVCSVGVYESPGGWRVVSGAEDGTIALWDPESRRRIYTVSGPDRYTTVWYPRVLEEDGRVWVACFHFSRDTPGAQRYHTVWDVGAAASQPDGFAHRIRGANKKSLVSLQRRLESIESYLSRFGLAAS